MDNKKLFLLLVALVLIYIGAQFLGGREVRTFKSEIVTVDTSQVTTISLSPKSAQQAEIRLQKQSDGHWQVSKGSISAAADPNAVASLLGAMTLIKAKRVAAKKEEKWKDYEVDDSGSRVKVYKGEELLADFVVGRFSFDQMTRSGTSFVRLEEQPEVYAVDGFLSLSFNQDMAAYRVKTILNTASASINQILLQADGTQYQIAKNMDGQWLLNGTSKLDSADVAQYINGLATISGTEFKDDFDANQGGAPEKVLQLSGDNMAPVSVSTYYQEGAEKPFIIKSSMNEAYFASDSSGVYKKLFQSLSELLITMN